MFTYYCKFRGSTQKEEFETLEDALEHIEAQEKLLFEYERPIRITDESGNTVWDDSAINQKLFGRNKPTPI